MNEMNEIMNKNIWVNGTFIRRVLLIRLVPLDWDFHVVIPLRAKLVGEFIEIRHKKFHPPVY